MELEEVWAGHGGVARSWGSPRRGSSLVLAVRKPPVVAKRTEASQTCSQLILSLECSFGCNYIKLIEGYFPKMLFFFLIIK